MLVPIRVHTIPNVPQIERILSKYDTGFSHLTSHTDCQTRTKTWILHLELGHGSSLITFLPETDVTLGELRRRLRPVLIGGGDPSRLLTPLMLLREVGTRLWQALLPGAVPAEVREALARELCSDTTTPLLLALPPELAGLPWELLCDPQGDAGFLALRRPIVRLIPDGSNLSPLSPPLRVLLLISSPPGLDEWRLIDVESERAAIESATRKFREAGLLHLLIEDIVTSKRVPAGAAPLQAASAALHWTWGIPRRCRRLSLMGG